MTDHWLATYTGLRLSVLNPKPEQIDILDIAMGLARTARFKVCAERTFSVAQHSIEVSRRLPPELRLWGLLHDASEAYIEDIPTPYKRHLPCYTEIEAKLMRVIAERFGLSWPMPAAVHEVDARMTITEARQFTWCRNGPDWHIEAEPYEGLELQPLPEISARFAFLARFGDYTQGVAS